MLSSTEFERLVSAGGPTGGELIRPTDRKPPKSIGFIQCVGSRSARKGAPYCSNICCMNTVKSTLVLKEHYPEIGIKVFYIDIRAFGKGFEDLYAKSRSLGVQYIRGLPGNVVETAEGGLRVAVDNGARGKISFHDLDMLVLAVGMKPSKTTKKLQEMFGLQLSPDGFFLEAHPKLQPVDAATKGIFFAGCAEGPKDIKESVTQGSAAAARVVRLLHSGEMLSDPITAEVIQEQCKICGRCAEVCPYGAISLDVKRKIVASVNSAACSGCGTCAAECPFDAIVMNHFTDEQIMGQVEQPLLARPGGQDSRLCMQLVFVRRGRLRRGVTPAISPNRSADPHHVLGPRGRVFHMGGIRKRSAANSGQRLPLRRLPLHKCQPVDRQAHRQDSQEDGKALDKA